MAFFFRSRNGTVPTRQIRLPGALFQILRLINMAQRVERIQRREHFVLVVPLSALHVSLDMAFMAAERCHYEGKNIL